MSAEPITFGAIRDVLEQVHLSRSEWCEAARRRLKRGQEPTFDLPLTEQSLPPLAAAGAVLAILARIEARWGTDTTKALLTEAVRQAEGRVAA